MGAPQQTFFPERGSILFQSNIRNCSDASFFNRDAEEVAKSLCGSYIWLAHSNITVRILETEAYSKQEPPLYAKVFARVPPSQLTKPPGQLLALNTVASRQAGSDAFFYVSAGGGDIVFIKALEPLEGLTEIRNRRGGVKQALKIFGPMTVADVFKFDLAEGSAVNTVFIKMRLSSDFETVIGFWGDKFFPAKA
jgi:3-methyladenine DNA glycosylase Mpg